MKNYNMNIMIPICLTFMFEILTVFDNFTSWHELSKIFSNDGVSSAMLNFAQLNATLKLHKGQANRPLVAILIGGMKDFYSFIAITKHLTTSYYRWLIIFHGVEHSASSQFCRKPNANLLNLKFNTNVLISCGRSRIIEEWSSEKVNTTTIRYLGRWINVNRKIKWSSEHDRYKFRPPPERLNLRVAIVNVSPLD